jgi:hypothetical protein
MRTPDDRHAPASAPASSSVAPPPGHPRPAWVAFLVAALFGAILALAAARLAAPLLGSAAPAKAALRATYGRWLPLLAAVSMLAVGWLAILAHELGHVVGGALGRFRFHMLVVGPLRIARDGEGGALRVGVNRSLALYGGVAAAFPTPAADPMRGLALMVAGGPLASVLLAAAAGLAAGAIASPGTRLLLIGLTLMSGGLALVTLVPARTGGFATDGARLLRMLRRGPEAEREAAMMPLVGLLGSGVLPREWPQPQIDAALVHRDGSVEECTAWLLAYLHRLDTGQIEAAGVALEHVLALRHTYPTPFAPALDVEAAYYAAAHRGDAAGARAMLAALPARSPGVTPHDRALVEAAVLRAEGDAEGAARIARDALPQVPASSAFLRARLALLGHAHAAETGVSA